MKVKHSIQIKEFNFQLLSFNQRDSGVESLPFINKHMVRYEAMIYSACAINLMSTAVEKNVTKQRQKG